jgi:hypothetical protein
VGFGRIDELISLDAQFVQRNGAEIHQKEVPLENDRGNDMFVQPRQGKGFEASFVGDIVEYRLHEGTK